MSLFSRNQGDDLRLTEKAPKELENAGLDHRFLLKQKDFQELSLTADRHFETISYSFDLDGFPVCDLEAKVHRSLDGLTTVMGDIPKATKKVFHASDWATLEQVQKIAGETVLMASLGVDYSLLSSEQCLWSESEELTPAWKMVVATQGVQYEMIANGNEVFRFDPRHFQETGSASVYAANINEGVPEAIALPDLESTGYLANKNFKICIPTASGGIVCSPSEGSPVKPFAKAPDFQFNYDLVNDTNSFIQASIFAHSVVALEWLQAHGYSSFGDKPIHLLAHAKVQGDINNALYQPGATAADSPTIYVGDGDGNILQNLGTDSDVVGHELGHHVIFKTVTKISGESLVIHEAMADYFTFARTGNACLGESICPDTVYGRQVCVIPKECLRTGENTLTFDDPNLPTEPHQRGQLVAGLLWDLNKIDGIPMDHVTNLVLKGIDLLVSNSGYKHLIVSLMLVDHSVFKDQYCSKILARAKVRGLSSVLSDVTCESIGKATTTPASVAEALGEVVAASTATTVVKKKKSCGVITAEEAGSGENAAITLLLILPALALWIRRKS
ncbi:MAG: hypothetical protein H7318_01055 [Oligoflexus sp.]|nr:hypothetical protein [Oligoflexus sp.]